MQMTREAGKVASLLFLSGLSALVYQTVWLRQFRLIFGASTAATGAVLAIFMLGLGLGSAWLGRRADEKERPLRFYARLELSISAAAALSPLLLTLAAKVYFASGGSPQLGAFGATLLRLALATVVLGPATLLMGGTLPAAARAIETGDDSGRRAVALLYGANSLGAVAGTLLSTFVLLERFGNRTTLLIAVGVNVVVALIARNVNVSGAAAASAAEIQTSEQPAAEAAGAPPVPRGYVYAAAAITGFAFLLLELVWYRMLSPILGGTTYMFGLVLAVALAGIACGGVLYAALRRGPATVGAFAITCSLEALAIIVPFALGDRIALLANALRELGAAGFAGHVAGWVIVTLIVVFPAAVIAGVQFPLLIALLGRGREDVGRQIGAGYAWNTAGAIAGSLAGGFGLLPLLGAPGTWRLIAVLLAVVAIASMVLARRAMPLVAITAFGALTLATMTGPTALWRHSGIGVARGPDAKTPNDLRRYVNERRRTVMWERDGRESSVALVKSVDAAFIVNGKSDGAARGDAGTQVMLGMIAAALHPRPESSLVVGLGTGSTAGWLGAIPSMQRVDVVELEPVVLDVARVCSSVNADVLSNRKVHIEIADAREVLLTTDRRYDLIASEPSNPYRAGIASLFTQEFYSAVRARLRPRGIFAQWMQTYAVHPETVRTVYATLTRVFPHVQTWRTSHGDLVLLATAEPLVIDVAELQARLKTQPYRAASFNAWRATNVESFLGHFFTNEDFARAAAKQAEAVNTDDRTVIEFGFARSLDAGLAVQEQLWRDAERVRMTRPRVRGAVDWDSVERRRPWLPRDDRPRDVGEAALMASEAANEGDPRAEELARVLASAQPIEADAVLGILRARQKRYDEAAELLSRAFVAYRRSPWPQRKVMEPAFPLAQEIAKSSPERAHRMFDALSQPFAAMQFEETRVFSRIVMAPLFDQCGAKTIAALRAAEPFPIWNREVLTIRANCYALARLPEAGDAWRDLERYVDAEPGRVVK
jgi:spermidine synthase